MYVFTYTLDQFNVSLLKKIINKKNEINWNNNLNNLRNNLRQFLPWVVFFFLI